MGKNGVKRESKWRKGKKSHYVQNDFENLHDMGYCRGWKAKRLKKIRQNGEQGLLNTMSCQSAGSPQTKILQETESIEFYNAFFP